ncbi:hypothetical protein L6R53_31360 [Myxococcota bacterium]|nr:hypothetical protein [Myxococcota bacterium]
MLDEFPIHTCAMPPDDVRIMVQMSSSVSQWYSARHSSFWFSYIWAESALQDTESDSSVKSGLREGEQDFESAIHYTMWAAPHLHPTRFQGEHETSIASPYGDTVRFQPSTEVIWNGDSNTIWSDYKLKYYFPSWLCLSVLRDDRMDLVALFDDEGSYWDGYLPGRMFYVMQSPAMVGRRKDIVEHPYGSSTVYMRSDAHGYPTTYSYITEEEVWSLPLDGGADDTAGDTSP